MKRNRFFELDDEDAQPVVINPEVVLHAFKSSGFLVVNKSAMQHLGLIKAVILSNYVDKYFYFSKRRNFDGSFFQSHTVIAEQLGIGVHVVRKNKNELIESGILISRMRGQPAREWFKFDFNKLYSQLSEFEQLVVPNLGGLGVGNPDGYTNENLNNENLSLHTVRARENSAITPFNTKTFKSHWKLWKQYRANEFKSKYKSIQSEQAALSKLSNMSNRSQQLAIDIIDQSIANSWRGLFPIRGEDRKPVEAATVESDNNLDSIKNIKQKLQDQHPRCITEIIKVYEDALELTNSDYRSKLVLSNNLCSLYFWIVNNQTTVAMDARDVPIDTQVITQYIDWIEDNDWITNIAEMNFNKANTLFQRYLREYSKEIGVNIITGIDV